MSNDRHIFNMYMLFNIIKLILCIFIHWPTPNIFIKGQKYIPGIQVQIVPQSQKRCWYFTFSSWQDLSVPFSTQFNMNFLVRSWEERCQVTQQSQIHEAKTSLVPVRSSRSRTSKWGCHGRPPLTNFTRCCSSGRQEKHADTHPEEAAAFLAAATTIRTLARRKKPS